jgi:predicted ArsR family transcriptional regulator
MNGLPDDVRQFITDNISSVAKLEVLLLLRNNPEPAWTAAAVAKALATSPEVMQTHLDEWLARGLLQVSEASERGYRYSPKSPELDRTVRDLADLYQARRVTVITQIYSEPVDKVRTFADAFRLRKEN